MQNFTENINYFSSLGTVIGQVIFIVIIGLLIHAKFAHDVKAARSRAILARASSWGMIFGFVVVIISTILSLVYSEVIGFVPCELCWIQRIFLYPQVVILGLALWKKTKDATTYCLALSGIGAVVALYNFYGQSFNPGALPACDALRATSCAVRYFVEFGYVTIPLMSLTAFLLIIISMLLAKSVEDK